MYAFSAVFFFRRVVTLPPETLIWLVPVPAVISPPDASAAAFGSAVIPWRTTSSGSYATISAAIISVGSAPVPVACSARSPSVLLSVAFAASLYQPFAISVIAPDGEANDPAFFERVTVGDKPVLPVIWSVELTM